jgi:hypothetical protein
VVGVVVMVIAARSRVLAAPVLEVSS